MNTDNYNLLKSSQPQGVDTFSPYIDKQTMYLPDSNQGQYNNNGLTLLQYDLRGIYNNKLFSDTADSFLAIPIVNCAVATDANGTPQTAPTAGASLVSFKSNYQHLIHSFDLVANGQTLSGQQSYVSMFNYFKLLSQVSATDLKTSATTWGMSEVSDSANSVQFYTRAAAVPSTGVASTVPQPGVGLCNNQIYNGTSAALGFRSFQAAAQNSGTVNEALQRRSARFVDTVNNTYNNIFGAQATGTGTQQPTILSTAQLLQEARPYYTVVGNYMYWYDVAIIPMKLLSDAMDKIGLVKKLDMQLRLMINTGYLTVPVTYGSASAANPQYGMFTGSTFQNTCPITLNLLPSATGGLPTTAVKVIMGCFIVRPLNAAISVGTGSINFATLAPSHFYSNARFYYPSISLSPAFAEQYITENRNKVVVYENLYSISTVGIAPGAAPPTIVQAGVRNPVGVLIVPLISISCPTTTAGGSTLGFSQFASPFDTCPASSSPCSLTNISVTIGGKNVLGGFNLSYTYENFIEQVALAQTIINEVSMNVGSIDQRWWEMNKYYWIDLARSSNADKASERNINITFNNNSSVPIDVMTFTVYLDEFVLDVETGIINKSKNIL
jgi:hypothetical protein